MGNTETNLAESDTPDTNLTETNDVAKTDTQTLTWHRLTRQRLMETLTGHRLTRQSLKQFYCI